MGKLPSAKSHDVNFSLELVHNMTTVKPAQLIGLISTNNACEKPALRSAVRTGAGMRRDELRRFQARVMVQVGDLQRLRLLSTSTASCSDNTSRTEKYGA
uniref:Uncharacterized protein n=1 Tax=Photinus pyralis TaxID=7054 RepID=A0A1Y1K5D5_PHOPY